MQKDERQTHPGEGECQEGKYHQVQGEEASVLQTGIPGRPLS